MILVPEGGTFSDLMDPLGSPLLSWVPHMEDSKIPPFKKRCPSFLGLQALFLRFLEDTFTKLSPLLPGL